MTILISMSMTLLPIKLLHWNRSKRDLIEFGFNCDWNLIQIRSDRSIFHCRSLLLTHARSVLIGKPFENFANLLLEIIGRWHMSDSLSPAIVLFCQLFSLLRERERKSGGEHSSCTPCLCVQLLNNFFRSCLQLFTIRIYYSLQAKGDLCVLGL